MLWKCGVELDFLKKNKNYLIGFLLYVIVSSILWFKTETLLTNQNDRNIIWDELLLVHYPPREHSIYLLHNIIIFFGILLIVNFFITRYIKGYFKVLCILLTVIFFFASIEISSRLYLKENSSLLRPHPTMLFEIMPGFDYPGYYETNSKGCLCPEFPLKKEPGEYRIVVVGDSTSFGIPVKAGERYSDQLEERLKEKYKDKKIRVINAAMASSSSMQIKNLVLEKVYKFSPDCLIVSINNDSIAEVVTDSSRLPNKYLLPAYRILYKSDLYLLLRSIVLKAKISKKKPIRNPNVGFVPPGRPMMRNDGKFTTVSRVSEQEAEENYKAIIRKMNDINAKTIILSMPLKDYVCIEKRRIRPDDPNVMHRKVIEKVCSENDAVCIDLFNEWNTDETNRNLFTDPVHLNKEGHKKITDEILKTMENEGFIK